MLLRVLNPLFYFLAMKTRMSLHTLQVQLMETISRLKADLAQAISTSSSSASAAVAGHAPYSHAHDLALGRGAASDDAVAGGHLQRLRFNSNFVVRFHDLSCVCV
jgi:hypothetical protein